MATSLKPGDVLLVEGNNHISGVIKYLTQSTWSHAALYVGPLDGRSDADGEPHALIEAELGIGVDSAPLSKYSRFHTRVCRPVGLTAEDCEQVCAYAIERIGLDYDLKNITDLMRYLMPLPVPQRWRRRALALGSGDPTRIICSALIAQAFESVRYPILPKVTRTESRVARRELLEIRHSLALRAARFRHLALFRGGEADDRERLRIQEAALGRPAAAADRGDRRRSRRATRPLCRSRGAGAAHRDGVVVARGVVARPSLKRVSRASATRCGVNAGFASTVPGSR